MASFCASGGTMGGAPEPEAGTESAGRANVPTPRVMVFRNLRRPFPFLVFASFFGMVLRPPLRQRMIPAPGGCCKASSTNRLQILQKRIRLTLAANGGAEAMAGEDGCFVREGQKLIADGTQQLLVGAAPQVGAPDAALEQRVAGKDALIVPRQMERKAARRVSRRVENFNRKRTPAQAVPLLQELVH